jgi:hypothetical protein
MAPRRSAVALTTAPLWERIAIFTFGVIFVVVLLVLAIVFPAPTSFQYTVFRIVLALAAAGIGALVPGFLEVRYKSVVRAGGALALFVVIYFFSPAALVATPTQANVGSVIGSGNISTQGQTGGMNTIVNQLVFQSQKLEENIWTEVTLKDVPPGVADYALLLFKSSAGRIIGRVRIKGSSYVCAFSTTANDAIPVAVQNVWVRSEGMYQIPTILEFSITEKPTPDAPLMIYTAGSIASRGREPH